MSRILLIDVDSKIPNLALMKLSSWHKSQGDQVGFNITEPDKIYASVVFKKNAHKLDGLKFFYPDAEIITGGSGIDLKATLPEQIERTVPDYELYPGMDYSLGFTSRGCVRNCYFCIVPKKEGKYQPWQHPKEWVRHDKAKLLDNNWYANPDWFFETSQWFIDNNIAVDLTQGMDIRLLTDEIAVQLAKLKFWNPIHFAFDDDKEEKAVLDGIQTLKDAGLEKRLRQDIMFYVYCHNDEHYESAVNRCRTLKNAGTNAFVMANIDRPRSQRVKHLQRWANRKWLFWSIDIDEYKAVV